MQAQLTIEIARPPEDVFAYLADVANLPAWQSGVRSAAIEGGGEASAGARVREVRQLLGREVRTTLEIEAFEPPWLFALRALDGPVPFVVRHELEPSGGGTLLTVTGTGDPGVLGFAAGLMTRRIERQLRTDFERLKQLLEEG